MRLIRDREGGRGYGGGGRGRLYTYRYIVTTRMTSALRWAAMTAILMFHNCEGQSYKSVSTNHNLFEEKGEPKWYQIKVLPFTSLPLGQTSSPVLNEWLWPFKAHFWTAIQVLYLQWYWVLHGWWHVKLLLFQCMFCVHHITMPEFTVTSCKATQWHM